MYDSLFGFARFCSLSDVESANVIADNIGKSNDLETVVHRNVESKYENRVELQPNPIGRECESREVANKLDINNNVTHDCKEPTVELSLKRLRGVQDTGRSVQDDRYILRRSVQSAFSRFWKDR